MIFDISTLGDDVGRYVPIDDTITIFLRNIYHQFIEQYKTSEILLLHEIVDTISHEELHKAFDECLDNPLLYDDHYIFKFLVT